MSNTKKTTSTRKPAVNTSTANVYEKLGDVQSRLKAPKNQYNSFGKYNYRSKEDIFEAAKPLCHENRLILTVSDDLVAVDGRFYIQATARVTDADTGDTLSAVGYAREPENKKGMDASQITGATSSYAGKYALGNLFGIDDTKESDTTNTQPPGGSKLGGSPKVMTVDVKASMLQAIKDGKAGVVYKRLKNYLDGPQKNEVLEAIKAATK